MELVVVVVVAAASEQLLWQLFVNAVKKNEITIVENTLFYLLCWDCVECCWFKREKKCKKWMVDDAKLLDKWFIKYTLHWLSINHPITNNSGTTLIPDHTTHT